MIISHRHRFIFVKTRKTAGSTIETFLRRLIGASDVATPLLPPPPDLLRPEGQNWSGVFNPLPDLLRRWQEQGRPLDIRGKGLLAPLIQLRRRQRYYEHMSLRLILERSPAICGDYFKFCFERNPWDKSLSWWLWSTRSRREELDFSDFERWVLSPSTKGYFSEWYMYTLNDEVEVDFVGRFENLREDLERALTMAGVSVSKLDLDLPHEKRTSRPDNIKMSAATIDRISRIFDREVRHFGYTVPSEFLTAR